MKGSTKTISLFPSHLLKEAETTPSSRGQLSIKRWCTPSFRPSELHTKTKWLTNEKKEHPYSEEGTTCTNCNKNRRTQTGQLKLKKKREEHSNNSLSDLLKLSVRKLPWPCTSQSLEAKLHRPCDCWCDSFGTVLRNFWRPSLVNTLCACCIDSCRSCRGAVLRNPRSPSINNKLCDCCIGSFSRCRSTILCNGSGAVLSSTRAFFRFEFAGWRLNS